MLVRIKNIQAHHWVFALMVLTIIYSFAMASSNDKLYQVILTPIIAGALDAVIYRIKDKKWEFPWLGLISGLIIASLLNPGEIVLAALVPAVAIILKHIIRRKINIFNPAALGLLIATFAGGIISWWAVSAIAMPFGIIAVYKTRRYYNAAAFLIIYVLLLALRSPQLLFLDYTLIFFALIMLIEPVTTPHTKKGQMVFGGAVAILATIFSIYTRLDFFIISLLIMNIFTYWLNKLR